MNYHNSAAAAVVLALGAVLAGLTEGSPLPKDAALDLIDNLEEAQQSPLLEAWLLRRIMDICRNDPDACSELELARVFAHIHGGLRPAAEIADDRRDAANDAAAAGATRRPEAAATAAVAGSGLRSDASARPPVAAEHQPSDWSKSVFGSLKAAPSMADGARTTRGKRTTVNNILFEIFKWLNIVHHNRSRQIIRIADE